MSIVSPKQLISSPFRNFPLPWRRPGFSPPTCSGSTGSLRTSFRTEGCSLHHVCGRSSATLWAQRSVSLPQSNGQSEHATQELEPALHCVSSHNQSTWSEQLPWIEYAHNSHTSAATGKSPFEASLGYQLPLLPAIKGEHSVPSVQAHLRRCHHAWRATRAALLRTKERNKALADCHRTPGPGVCCGTTGMAVYWLCATTG